jgi:DNA-binding transcriptional MerR regulator
MSYTVGEAAKILGVATSTLRYYEQAGLLTSIERTAGGQRLFSDVDMEACRVIECLKESGLSIKDIKAFMDMVAAGDTSLPNRLALFEARRDALKREIAEMQSVLDVLEFKC